MANDRRSKRKPPALPLPGDDEPAPAELLAFLRATSEFSIAATPGHWVPVAPKRRRRRRLREGVSNGPAR